MICPIDPNFDCPYEDEFEEFDFISCEDFEVCFG